MHLLKASVQLDGWQRGERILDFRRAHLRVPPEHLDVDLALAPQNVSRHLDLWNGAAQAAAETIPTQALSQPLELDIFCLDSKRKRLGGCDQIGPCQVADFNRAAINGHANGLTKSQRVIPQGDWRLNLGNRLKTEAKRFDGQCSRWNIGRTSFANGCGETDPEGQCEIYWTKLPFVGFDSQAAASELEISVDGKIIQGAGHAGGDIDTTAQD